MRCERMGRRSASAEGYLRTSHIAPGGQRQRKRRVRNYEGTATMPIGIESESARAYLTLLQGVITRMAGNSTSCKTWCVTIVSAIFALALDKNKPQSILVGFLPV